MMVSQHNINIHNKYRKKYFKFIVLAIICLTSCLAYAQKSQVADPKTVKTQYIFLLTKFIRWSKESSNKEILLCFINSDDYKKYTHIIDGRTVSQRTLKVVHSPTLDTKTSCDIAFLSANSAIDNKTFIQHYKQQHVVTISDKENFCATGGIIQLYQKSKRILFSINKSAANTEDIQLSSQILALAKQRNCNDSSDKGGKKG